MFEKSGKYYADWRDKTGRRRRKAFKSERAALRHEEEQKELAHPKGKATGRQWPHSSSPRHAVKIVAAKSTKQPSESLPKLAPKSRASSNRPTPPKSTKQSAARVMPIHRSCRATAIRALLRWLWTHHGAPKLDDEISKYPGIRPRNVTATDTERELLLNAAAEHMRLFILFCSDLAIRAGTAGTLRPENYDKEKGTLRFTTKKGEKVTLPVTQEIRDLIESCNLEANEPFVRQLWRQEQGHGRRPYREVSVRASTLSAKFRKLKEQVGIERKLTPHDLRRTTAVAMLEATRDVRDVQALLGHRSLQSTIWYLDHDLRPVKRSLLEIIKRPAWRKEHTA